MKIIQRVLIHAICADTKTPIKDFAFRDGKPLYHYLINREGEIRQFSREAWSLSDDHFAIHIGFIGGAGQDGKPADNRTAFQKEAMFYKLVELTSRYHNLEVKGAEGKTKPAFDVQEWMKSYEPTLALDREEMAMAA